MQSRETVAISGAWDDEFRFSVLPQWFFPETGDGRHTCWFEDLPDGRIRFVWDGLPGEAFDQVVRQPDDAFVVWSQGDLRIAYKGVRNGRSFVGVDDTESELVQGFDPVPPTFSPDGSHLACGVFVDDLPRLIFDGHLYGSWRPALTRPVFSRDGLRFAFVAENGDPQPDQDLSDYRQWIVLDGVAQPETERISAASGGIQFSPDGGRFVYPAIASGRIRFVLDGIEHPPYVDVKGPTFSPDGRHFAYLATLEKGMALIYDGVAGPTYETIGPPVFSPDGHRLAYGAFRSKGRFVAVIDGVDGPEFSDCWGNPAFSPDSRRTAYLSMRPGSGLLGSRRPRFAAVVDGVIGSAWDEVASDPHFSPDSAQVAFSARRDKAWSIVLDDAPGPVFDKVGPPSFGSTGHLAYLAQSGSSSCIMLGGMRGPSFDEPAEVAPGESFILSPDGAHVATIGRMKDGWHPIVDQYVGPAYVAVGRPRFEGGRATFSALREDSAHHVSITVD